jgi:hypothetical protein
MVPFTCCLVGNGAVYILLGMKLGSLHTARMYVNFRSTIWINGGQSLNDVLHKIFFHLVEDVRVECKLAKNGRKYGDSYFDFRCEPMMMMMLMMMMMMI